MQSSKNTEESLCNTLESLKSQFETEKAAYVRDLDSKETQVTLHKEKVKQLENALEEEQAQLIQRQEVITRSLLLTVIINHPL